MVPTGHTKDESDLWVRGWHHPTSIKCSPLKLRPTLCVPNGVHVGGLPHQVSRGNVVRLLIDKPYSVPFSLPSTVLQGTFSAASKMHVHPRICANMTNSSKYMWIDPSSQQRATVLQSRRST